jgi:hypothetical protein
MLFDCKGADIITPIKYTHLSLKSFYGEVKYYMAMSRLTAALVDPLFAFGGKRVEEKNNFVMLNSVKDLFNTMISSRIDPSLSLRMTKKKLPLSAEGEERDGERSKARVSLNRNITITHYIKFAYTQSVKHSNYQTHKLFPFLCAFIIKNLNALF